MNAVNKKTDVACYVSNRVFDGTRKVTDPVKADRMRKRVEKALADAGVAPPKTVPKA